METKGFRITVHTGEQGGDAASFVRVLATVVNPTPVYLASTARTDRGVRCTFMVRNRKASIDGLLVEDILHRVSGRYLWSDVELVSATGSPIASEPAVETAA